MKKLLNTLYINSSGRYLSLDGENVVIRFGDAELGRIPLHNLDGIICFGCSGASPALMGKCAGMGIDLIFMSGSGRFIARVEGEVKGNVLLRREQFRIADDEQRSLDISRNIIASKIYNSRWSVERTIRDHSMRIDTERFGKISVFLRELTAEAMSAENAAKLRGIEGEAASEYFSLFDDMILRQKDDFYFERRSKRPPLDNVNALLSFAYSIETGMCCSALEAVGLDPYVGFMHTDRPGRKSLALDLVEEFRTSMCDRFVLTLINKRIISAADFDKREDGAVLLSESGRKKFFDAWQKRKQEEIMHPFLNEKIQWGMLPYSQALLLARYIRGDIDAYPPFMWK